MIRRMSFVVVVATAALLVGSATPAFAHLHEQVGNIEVTLGWVNEPSFAGEPNAVQLILTQVPAGGSHTHEGEETGTPLPTNRARLSVEVIFGDRNGTEKTEAKPLTAYRSGSPGEWRSESFVPTRSGTYTFHITGTLDGKPFDKYYTSGDTGAIEGTRYDDVRDVAGVSFPAKDPSNGDLSRALDETRRLAAGQVKKASDDAKTARLLAIIGIAIGVVGLGAAALRRPKKAVA